jgi:hypothetical protein
MDKRFADRKKGGDLMKKTVITVELDETDEENLVSLIVTTDPNMQPADKIMKLLMSAASAICLSAEMTIDNYLLIASESWEFANKAGLIKPGANSIDA